MRVFKPMKTHTVIFCTVLWWVGPKLPKKWNGDIILNAKVW